MMFMITSCEKQASDQLAPKNLPEDESVVLKPKEGYSSSKRSEDYIASMERGKPVKNNVGNITSLMTTAESPYQINLNWYGVNGAVKYNVYRNDVLVGSTVQPLYSDFGLTQNTKYKYQVAGVASNGVVGNLSNIAFGTTWSVDIGDNGNKVLIFLQFDKDTVTNSWGYTVDNPLIVEASGFTEEEKQIITDGIAADYAQFNVKVTRDRAEYFATSKERRTKTIFTQSYQWYSGPTPTAGGVSYLGTLGADIPNFVFTSALSYNTHYNIVAGTHEDGHGIGALHHAIDYCGGPAYGSDGNHMGAAYYAPVRFWSNGHLVTGCTYEDQITTLTARTQ